MKLALVTLAVTSACVTGTPGDARGTATPIGASAIPVPEVAASQWIPAHPTYLALAPSLAEASGALAGLVDTVGTIVGVDPVAVRGGLANVLGVDLFDARALADTGIDVRGGLVMFSDDVAPTFVAHLHDAARFHRFVTEVDARRPAPSTRVVDGIEVSSSDLGQGMRLAWAADGEWLWLHVSLPGGADDGAWLSSSRRRDPSAPWLPEIAWAKQVGGGAAVFGVADPRVLVERIAQLDRRVPCLVAATSLRRVAFASSSGPDANLHITAELAAGRGAELQHLVHAPTQGWETFAAAAALQLQWNLDVPAVLGVLRSCGLDVLAGISDPVGIRAARVAVLTIDPRLGVGTGVVEASISSTRFVDEQLDQIPLRSHLESDVRFGTFAGKHLKIPFTSFALDYVLTPSLVMVGVGDGLLARAIGRGATTSTSTLVRFEVRPHALTVQAWGWLLDKIVAHGASAIATTLQHWHDLQVGVTIDHDTVSLDLRADR